MVSAPAKIIKMYAARTPIYPRAVAGRYANLRWLCVVLTQLVFYGLPWMQLNGRQALLFDLVARKFYIFGVVLWPQDFIYLAVLLIICAYGLFLVTAVGGRIWCGFACPQTVYTKLFLWIEATIEGQRSARISLDRGPLTLGKFFRKAAKHACWGALALWTGFTFVGYFTPIATLSREIASISLGPWEMFWIGFYSLATYGNAGWLREQVCLYMCPYARFQSAMFDRDTLLVTYDVERGEPRGALHLQKDGGHGDCIDCSLCVQVCPTGIDIRNGLQYACIGCAACVDACEGVMDKVAKPRGLIRFATEHGLAQKLSPKEITRRAMRPRILVYCAILLLIIGALFTALTVRKPLKLDVIRDRGSMGRVVGDDLIENVYRLQIMNTSEQSHRFTISASGLPALVVDGPDQVVVGPTETRPVAVRLRVPRVNAKPGTNPIHFALQGQGADGVRVEESAIFYVPR